MDKAIIITNGNYPFGGASANYLRLLSLGLSKEGIHTKVILPSGYLYGKDKGKIKSRKNTYENIEYLYLGFKNHPSSLLLKFLSSIFGFISTSFYLIAGAIKSDFKIIIHYNSSIAYGLMLLFVRLISNTRLVYILPEFYEKPAKGSSMKVRLKWYNHFLGLKYFTKHADGIIVFSRYLKDYILNQVRFKNPVLKIPNLTDPSLFNFSHSKSFKKDLFTIGYTGTPTSKDGIFDLIEGFKCFNDKYPLTHLLVIGDLTNGKTVIEDLKHFAGNLGIENKITFTGLLPFIEVPPLLCMCDLLVLTRPEGRFAEAGFPTKLGEYLACKKPVLLTKVGDVKEYFTNQENAILVNPGDIQEIANSFEFLYNNPDKAKEIREKGFQWMLENLEYKKITAEIASFLNALILNRPN